MIKELYSVPRKSRLGIQITQQPARVAIPAKAANYCATIEFIEATEESHFPEIMSVHYTSSLGDSAELSSPSYVCS
jgi:hypothetical protein